MFIGRLVLHLNETQKCFHFKEVFLFASSFTILTFNLQSGMCGCIYIFVSNIYILGNKLSYLCVGGQPQDLLII